MTFYPNLAVKSAALIAKFGQQGQYVTFEEAVYDNATGTTTKGAETSTTVSLLELSGFGPKGAQEWTEEVIQMSRAVVLVSATEMTTADVVPEVNETIVYEGKSNRIIARQRVGPAGVAVIWKFAVQYV